MMRECGAGVGGRGDLGRVKEKRKWVPSET